MNKILIATIFSLFALQLLAQPSLDEQMQQKMQQRSSRYQQIQSAKIAFFTSELELTPKEAEEFWPLYNQYWRARERINRRAYQTLNAIENQLKLSGKESETKLKQLLEIYLEISADESAIHKEYYNKFLKIFSIKKVAKIYTTEEAFRIKMIRQLRSSPAPVVEPK